MIRMLVAAGQDRGPSKRLARSDEAVGEYRRALEVVPDAESATIALASVFMHEDRDAAMPCEMRRRDEKGSGIIPISALLLALSSIAIADKQAFSALEPSRSQ